MDLTFKDQDNHDTSFVAFLENHLQEVGDAKVHPFNATDSYQEEANMQVAVRTCLLSHPKMISIEADAVAINSTSDQEEHFLTVIMMFLIF